jgi:hypothetical protein
MWSPVAATALAWLAVAPLGGCQLFDRASKADRDDSAESDDAPKKKKKKKKKKSADTEVAPSATAAATSASAVTTTPTTPTATSAPSPIPTSSASPVATTLSKRFDRTGLTLVPDDCPLATLSFVAPGEPTGPALEMFVAFSELSRVRDAPGAPNQVQVVSVGGDDTFGGPAPTTVGRCGSGLACNELAAFLFRLRSFPKPQVWCGKGPFHGTESANWSFAMQPPPPAPTDVPRACARLSACALHTDPASPKDAYKTCVGRPAQHKLSCVSKTTCNEVVACSKG